MNSVIEGSGALVNERGEETPIKAGDFALVKPDEKHKYRNTGDKPFKMIAKLRQGFVGGGGEESSGKAGHLPVTGGIGSERKNRRSR